MRKSRPIFRIIRNLNQSLIWPTTSYIKIKRAFLLKAELLKWTPSESLPHSKTCLTIRLINLWSRVSANMILRLYTWRYLGGLRGPNRERERGTKMLGDERCLCARSILKTRSYKMVLSNSRADYIIKIVMCVGNV